MSTSLNGWPILKSFPTSTYFTTPMGKRVYCANDDVAVVFAEFTNRWHNEVSRLEKATYNTYPNERKGFIVSHAFRPIGRNAVGIGNRSNHHSGTGMDHQGHKYPYQRTAPRPFRDGFTQAQRNRLRKIRSEITDAKGHPVLRLGIDFPAGYIDGMHVEIGPGVSKARVKQAADKIRKRNGGGSIKPPKGYKPRLGLTSASKVGRRSHFAKVIQAMVGRRITGVISTGDIDAVKALQRRLKVTPDGVVGLVTVRAYLLRYAPSVRRGSRGPAVRLLQYIAGVPFDEIDGVAGGKTDVWFKRWQAWAGVTADGIVGANTRSKGLRA